MSLDELGVLIELVALRAHMEADVVGWLYVPLSMTQDSNSYVLLEDGKVT